MTTELEKAQLGASTITNFCDQFGQDVFGKILLEVLLEGLLNEETVFIFGEQEQAGNQVDHSSSGQERSVEQNNGLTPDELAYLMGE